MSNTITIVTSANRTRCFMQSNPARVSEIISRAAIGIALGDTPTGTWHVKNA